MSSPTDRTSGFSDSSNPPARPPESVTLAPVAAPKSEPLVSADSGVHAPGASDGPTNDDHPRIPGYEIERELGRGGMFLAESFDVQRRVK